ncbi:MAG TPA: hypothetical protein VNU45_18050 [Rummeliibacillus sp.]|nr:hypothetical protein [Rummeliibacillus sp.]
MNHIADFKKLAESYKLTKQLFKKGLARVSINPTYSLYHDRKYLIIFLHVEYENGEHSVFDFETEEELLNKIKELIG